MKKILITTVLSIAFLSGSIAQVYASNSDNSAITATIKKATDSSSEDPDPGDTGDSEPGDTGDSSDVGNTEDTGSSSDTGSTDDTTSSGESTDSSDKKETKPSDKTSPKDKSKGDTGYIATGSVKTYMYTTIGASLLALVIGFISGRYIGKKR